MDMAQQVNVIQVLLQAGTDVNLKDSKGQTALMNAIKSRRSDIVQLLKEAGAKG